jgi:hypothetical protein
MELGKNFIGERQNSYVSDFPYLSNIIIAAMQIHEMGTILCILM